MTDDKSTKISVPIGIVLGNLLTGYLISIDPDYGKYYLVLMLTGTIVLGLTTKGLLHLLFKNE